MSLSFSFSVFLGKSYAWGAASADVSTLGILANVSATWKRLGQSPGGCVISFLCKQKACYLHCVQLWDVVCVFLPDKLNRVPVLGWVTGSSSYLYSTPSSGAESCSHAIVLCSGMQCCCW